MAAGYQFTIPLETELKKPIALLLFETWHWFPFYEGPTHPLTHLCACVPLYQNQNQKEKGSLIYPSNPGPFTIVGERHTIRSRRPLHDVPETALEIRNRHPSF
ncbi:hypothetical protein JMJ77_0014221 [Colletotrichum scovillei]|uniref:Uncharacterized protein n=1 Tax=Colletotrichum scovillei TaxID=1209932 RepID=A0A9P7R5I5_9PEZI|nr:hypothetical protein JMJ77_0014221 [Colletotrichum scovillei]KAG7065747.1 hypothetical protein JMJ78_0012495 [Colletotrichum scovillei]KAG7068352.1 hypothetical protein JMJ76_0008042 [Colletotrichum scovillei]